MLLIPNTTWTEARDGLAADGVSLNAANGWATLTTRVGPGSADTTGAMLGRPGLWKPAEDEGGRPSIVFDVPLRPLMERLDEGPDDAGDTGDVVAAIARWAAQTKPGRALTDWAPPPARHLDRILPPASLSLRSGPFIQQAQIAAEPRQLSLRVTICPLARRLPAARRRWIDRLLTDCRSLRMVRVGIRKATDGAAALDAEIDLTGAPPGVLEAALPLALDALQACFSLIVATATFVCDASARSEALARDPSELLDRLTDTPASTRRTA